VSARRQQDVDAPAPLVSCLCVTEGRAAFMPWLLWNFDRQTWPRKELVIVDSSTPTFASTRPDVRVVPAAFGSNVPVKRNLALDQAHGDIVAWFDDDDWQHPRRLSVLVDVLRDGCSFAGGARSWFVDLFEAGCTRYSGGHSIVFNTAAFWTDVARAVRFNVGYRRASDTVWMRDMATRHPNGGRLLEDESLSFWLCHEHNISNPRERRTFSERMDAVRAALGSAWGDTDRELAALRARLPPPEDVGRARWRVPRRPPEPEAAVWEPARGGRLARRATLLRGRSANTYPLDVAAGHPTTNPPDSGAEDQGPIETAAPAAPVAARAVPPRWPRPAPDRARGQRRRLPEVGAVVLVPAAAASSAEALVPHILGQAQFPFRDRAAIVDGPSSAAVDAALDRLVRDGHLDRILRAPRDTGERRALCARYFPDAESARGQQGATPEGAAPETADGSLLAELAALDLAGSDHVFLARLGTFFFTSGVSWVAQALSRLRDDPSLWLVTTQAGPPLGASGTLRSQSGSETTRASWDRRAHLWRLRDAAAPAFLIDRRRLRGRLRFDDLNDPAAGLSDCLSAALGRAGAARGALGLKGSWALHAPAAHPLFPAWAPHIARLVEQGIVPATQRGPEIRLGDPPARDEWQPLIERAAAAAAAAAA
jgi:hypothetical protein